MNAPRYSSCEYGDPAIRRPAFASRTANQYAVRFETRRLAAAAQNAVRNAVQIDVAQYAVDMGNHGRFDNQNGLSAELIGKTVAGIDQCAETIVNTAFFHIYFYVPSVGNIHPFPKNNEE